MKTYTKDQLQEILDKHKKWFLGEEGGQRVDLSNADLSNANLRFADLRDANLSNADLIHADLRHADLKFANLRFADLKFANLGSADLKFANLGSADLRHADLKFANLSNSNLSATLVHMVSGQTLVSVGNIGSRNAITVYHADLDTVFCGCFRGTLDEFIKEIEKSYPAGHKHREEYDIAIRLFRLKKSQMEEDAQ